MFRRFEPGKEHYSSVDFNQSWLESDHTQQQDRIDRILRGNLKDSPLLLNQLKDFTTSEVVGRQETWLFVYGGVEGNSVKSDLHVVVCTKELRCIPSTSGLPSSIAAETMSDWKFESVTPRTSGFRSPFRYCGYSVQCLISRITMIYIICNCMLSYRSDYPAVILHIGEKFGGDRMLVYGGSGTYL